jgi:succinoglycan biosynthesis protein ExoV
MKLTYWKGAVPNFGDELNPWLWARLLPGFFDDDASTLFVGIGSILYDYYPRDAEKIVFGTGYGGYTNLPVIDETWKVYFVRGPRTAASVGLDAALGVGDAAALICTLADVQRMPRQCAGPAFMPHWESAVDGRWERAASVAGLRYIDPRWDVERVIREIAASERLVTEAMHGAIVADALRVPFAPFLPIRPHRAKWDDWGDAMELTIAFAPSAPSTLLEAVIRLFNRLPAIQWRLRRSTRLRGLPDLADVFVGGAAAAIRRAARQRGRLSPDAVWQHSIAHMIASLEQLRADFPARDGSPVTPHR